MNFTQRIAKQLRDVHFGPNWTAVNLKDTLTGVTWQQATTRVYSFNSIAALVFHINYYISAVIKVLEGGELNAHDKYSYDLQPITSQQDWEALLNKMWNEAEQFIVLVEQLPDSKLWEYMADEKYGDYFRNLEGCVEHAYYHMGQIVLIKKMILQEDTLAK